MIGTPDLTFDTSQSPGMNSVATLATVESDITTTPFDPGTAIRNELDAQGKERGILSSGRFQMTNTTAKDLLDRGIGGEFFTPKEREILQHGNFEEQKGLMITRAGQMDRLAMKKLRMDQERLGFNNPIADGYHWQNPRDTIAAIQKIAGDGTWADVQKKHGKKGAALLLINEMDKTGNPDYISRGKKFRENIDALTGPAMQLTQLDAYSQELLWDMYSVSPTDEKANLQASVSRAEADGRVDRVRAMVEESDDPTILGGAIETALDALAVPGDMNRAWIARLTGLEVSEKHMETGRIPAEEFILTNVPGLAPFLKGDDIPDWDNGKPFMENLLGTIQAVNSKVAGTITTLGVDMVTDPLMAIAPALKSLSALTRWAFGGVEKVVKARGEKAIQAQMAEAKADVDAIERTEKVLHKGHQPSPLEEIGMAMAGGSDTVADVNKALHDIEVNVRKTIAEREAELATGMNRTIAQANREAAEQIVRESFRAGIEDSRKLLPNTPINDVDYAVWAQSSVVLNNEITHLSKLRARAKARGDEAGAEALLKKATELNESYHNLALSRTSGLSAAGRVERFSQEGTEFGGQLFSVKKMDQTIQKRLAKAGMDIGLYMDSLAAMDDPLKAMRVAQIVGGPTTFDKYHALLVNSLLSGPATQVLNTATGFTSLTYGGVQRTLGALLTNPLGGNPAKADLRDAAHYWGGALMALPETIIALGKAPFDKKVAINKLMASEQTKLSTMEGTRIPMGGVPKAGDGPVTQFIRSATTKVGNVAQTPVSIMMTMDRATRHIMGQAELKYLASQRVDELLDTGAYGTVADVGKARREAMNSIMANPEAYGDLYKQAIAHADEGVFTTRLEGTQKALQEARESSRVARLAIPFFKAIMNIGNYEFRRMPGIQFASPKFRAQLKSDDPMERQLAHGNMALGTSIAASGFMMAQEGMITGAPPSNPQQRDIMQRLGQQPYSFAFDTDDDGMVDQYVSYKNWGPVGTILGTMATLQQAGGYTNEEEWETVTGHAMMATTELLMDKTLAESVTNFFKIWTDNKDNPETFSRSMEEAVRTYSLVSPKFLEYLQRIEDPVIRDKDGLLEGIMARNPAWSQSLPAEVDIMGNEIYHPMLDPEETDVLTRSVMSLFGTTAPTSQLTEAQENARVIIQPFLDENIQISKPEREIGTLTLNKEQKEYLDQAFYRGGFGSGMETSLLEDLNSVYNEWNQIKAQMDPDFIRQMLADGGIDPSKLENMSPNAMLQSLTSAMVTKRKQQAMDAMVEKFDSEIGNRVLAEQMKQGYIKAAPRNPRRTSPGGKRVDDLIQQHNPEGEADPIDTILDAPRRIQERLNFSIGGQ